MDEFSGSDLTIRERTPTHGVIGIRFTSGSLMRQTQICDSPVMTAIIILYTDLLYDISTAGMLYCVSVRLKVEILPKLLF